MALVVTDFIAEIFRERAKAQPETVAHILKAKRPPTRS
jgi:hypothetical protein